MPIPAGTFTRRVKVLTNSPASTNAFGEAVDNWTIARTIWCDVNNRSAVERAVAGRYEAQSVDVFTIRYCTAAAAMDPAQNRLRYQGRDYDIKAITEVGYREAFDVVGEVRADNAPQG